MSKKLGKIVRLHFASGDVNCELLPDDFLTLHKIAEQPQTEIKHIDKAYRRLRGLGLVRHVFTSEEWPRAVARLTQAGEQALSQRDI